MWADIRTAAVSPPTSPVTATAAATSVCWRCIAVTAELLTAEPHTTVPPRRTLAFLTYHAPLRGQVVCGVKRGRAWAVAVVAAGDIAS